MTTNRGPNWQGILVMVGLLVWTLSNIYDKLTKPDLDRSWWVVTAPATIFTIMVVLIYWIVRLSVHVERRSRLTK